MPDLNNLPSALNYYDLNDIWVALKTSSAKLKEDGEKTNNDILTTISENHAELAKKVQSIMKHLSGSSDLKMIVVNPVEKQVFDYAFRDTLGIKE